ncbi:MAG: sugar-binding domain-containing protein, partial [Anaerolineales bacterium]
EKLNAQAVYINAPFIVEDQKIATSLLDNKNVQESLVLARQAQIALLGVGSSDLAHCSYYLADYVTKKEILEIQRTGAIGDVCGRFFDINGNNTANEFQNRLIGISLKNLMRIPFRIGVAGGPAKIDPIIGALRGRLINVLISDIKTIKEVITRTND